MKELTLSKCREQFAGSTANFAETQICITNFHLADSCQGKLQ